MFVFDLDKKEEEGEWFSFFNSHPQAASGEIVYDQPEEDAAEFCIRSLNPFWDERRKGRKRESKMVINPQTRAMERVSYYADLSPEDEVKENEDAWDYAITGMRKAFSAPGLEIACTRENKLKLRRIPVFARFFFRVQEILTEAGVKKAEDAPKN